MLLDRWEGFTLTLGETDGGRLTDAVTRILGEGASAGLHLVMTGDRSLIASRISSMTDEKLAFRLPDSDDVSLIGLRARDLPDDIPPGHAFRGESGIEIQAARPPVVRRRLAAAAGRRRRRAALGLVGVGGDDLAAYGPDLADGMPAFIVGGPAKSGRSCVLVTMARSFLASGAQLIVVAPRSSPLRSLRGLPGVVRVFDGTGLPADEFAAAVGEFSGPGVVVIDDAEVLRECDAAEELKKLIAFGGDQRQARVRLQRSLIGEPVKPGRALLNTGGGNLVTVAVPLD